MYHRARVQLSRSRPTLSLLWVFLAVLAVALLVSPWGNYPLNDDWQYARIARRLSETGRFLVDVDVAPSLVGQIWLAAPFLMVFGFSHTLLRAITIAVAVLLCWLVDRIVSRAGAPPGVRVLSGALLVANPIFLHVTFSFMTEVYGYALALAGALVWLHGRSRREGAGAPVISWTAGLAAATIIGGSFWIRQFCAAVFPALLAAAVLRTLKDGDRLALRRSLPVAAATIAWFSVVVVGYFAWAKLSGNYRPAFGGPIRSLVHLDRDLWLISAFEAGTYLTAFLFPFLCLERWRETRWSRFAAIAAAGAILVFAARLLQPQHLAFHHHLRFPFAANVIYDTGVGPITLTHTYFDAAAARPRWTPAAWLTIEWLLAGGLLAWARIGARRSVEPRPPADATEIRDFGWLLAALSFVLSVQAYQWTGLDRYYFPCVLGAVIALSARATSVASHQSSVASRPAPFVPPARIWAALAMVLPLAWFSIAGVHDYFRWNDARWAAVALAERDGARPDVLDGGYEVNGWLNYDATMAHIKPAGCRGECRCPPVSFYCTDDSYVISMGALSGRTTIAELPVSWWLAGGPAIVLSRR